MKKLNKSILIAAALAATSAGLATPTQAGLTTTGNTGVTVDKNTPSKNALKQGAKATRLTSSRRCGYQWLLPVTKQTFKQNRRKELTASRKKRNKQF